jgi:sulfur dioxygenase
MINSTKKCDIVVIRKKNVVNVIFQQQLQQSQADNVRLQHRISYLEEQVKELLTCKDYNEKAKPSPASRANKSGTHITSISISSSPNNTQSEHDEEKPTVYQRGSFITTLVNGKPLDPLPATFATSKSHSALKIPSSRSSMSNNYENSENNPSRDTLSSKTLKQLSSSLSRISINSDLCVHKKEREKRDKDRKEKSGGIRSTNGWSVEHLNKQK